MWEFPGGKIEQGETQKQALTREIKEELNVKIDPYEFLTTVEYTYPEFHLTMYCYISKVTEGKIELLEHNDSKWLTINEIDTVEWLPADIDVIKALKDKY